MLLICKETALIEVNAHQNQERKSSSLKLRGLATPHYLCVAKVEVHPAKSAIALLVVFIKHTC